MIHLHTVRARPILNELDLTVQVHRHVFPDPSGGYAMRPPLDAMRDWGDNLIWSLDIDISVAIWTHPCGRPPR